MNKKLLKMITILILLIVPLLTACGGDDGDNHEHEQTNPNEIEFSETNAFIRRTTAYTNMAQVGRRTYFFSEDDVVVNTQFINTVESIIDRLGDFIEIPYAQLRIRHTLEPQDFHFSATEVSLNFNDIHTFGWLTHILSRGELPMWLSAGLEAYVKADLGLFAPMEYTGMSDDLEFLPSGLGTDHHAKAISNAYHMVAEMSRNNLLGHKLLYADEYLRNSLNLLNSTVVVVDDFGNSFHFFFDETANIISLSDIEYYVEYMQNAINFTVDFMSGFKEFQVTPLRTYVHYEIQAWGGGYDGHGHIEIFGIRAISVMTHEVVHAIIISMIGGERPLLSFEEGFAEYVRLSFNKSQHFYHQLPFGAAEAGEYAAILIREFYNSKYNYIDHFIAYYRLTNIDYAVIGAGFPPPRLCPSGIDAINAYDTATSFVLWLIQNHGIDAFMSVLWDADNFVNVYYKDIYGMVDEWRDWLFGFVLDYEGDWDDVLRLHWGR